MTLSESTTESVSKALPPPPLLSTRTPNSRSRIAKPAASKPWTAMEKSSAPTASKFPARRPSSNATVRHLPRVLPPLPRMPPRAVPLQLLASPLPEDQLEHLPPILRHHLLILLPPILRPRLLILLPPILPPTLRPRLLNLLPPILPCLRARQAAPSPRLPWSSNKSAQEWMTWISPTMLSPSSSNQTTNFNSKLTRHGWTTMPDFRFAPERNARLLVHLAMVP